VKLAGTHTMAFAGGVGAALLAVYLWLERGLRKARW
jgi:hypothetical protein